MQPELFLLPRHEVRLPGRPLLAWCRGDDLDLFFLGLLGFAVASLLAFGHSGLLLLFEMIELVRHQDLPARGADPHVDVALLHQLLGLPQCAPHRNASEIFADAFMVATDQVFQLRHGGRPPRSRRTQAIAARRPAVQSTRPDEIAAKEFSYAVRRERARGPQSPVDATGNAVITGDRTPRFWE